LFVSFAIIPLTDELFLIGFANNPIIFIWNWNTKAQVRKLIGHKVGRVKALVKFKDNITLASGSCDCTIRIWNLTIGFLLRNISGHTDCVNDLALISDERLASSSQDSTIRIWNSANGTLLRILLGHELYVLSIQLISEDCLASGSQDKTLRLWNLTTGREIKTIWRDITVIQCLLLLNDSKFLATGEWACTVSIWNLETNQHATTLEGHSQPVYSLANLKESHLASGSQDCTIKIWYFPLRIFKFGF
jgi:WD40 repeat protein